MKLKNNLQHFKILLLTLVCSSFFLGCQENTNTKKPRIAIAGIRGEMSEFSPAVTLEKDFRVSRDQEVFDNYPFFAPDSNYIDQAQWLPTVFAQSTLGGTVSKEAFESLSSQILEGLVDQLPLDALFLDIHGAMSVEGTDDPEGDLISRIRDSIGTDVLISTTMDLHGSVSQTLAKKTDLITAFRKAPHEDRWETKKRALDNLLNRLKNGKGKPEYKAWVPVPVLLPGEQTSTRIEPGKSLYAEIPTVIDDDKVIDASIWMSYPWADKPRNHGVVMTYGDDKEAVGEAAQKLARQFWEVRKDFDFVAPTVAYDTAIKKAIASKKSPFIISDMGDNPGAGGTGDVTWTLQHLLDLPEFTSDDGKSWIYASIWDKNFVKKAVEAGVDHKIEGKAGASIDSVFAGPVDIQGTVHAIHKGENGTQVAIKIGNSYALFTDKRMAYHSLQEFKNLDLDPREVDVLVVKQGYLVPELYHIRKGWVMALTPGSVDQDLPRLNYKRINRPMYPLDPDMDDPDLSPRFIPKSDELH